MIGVVIFADNTKILVRSAGSIIKLGINEHSKLVKFKDEVEFEGDLVNEKFNNRNYLVCLPTSLKVIKSYKSVNKVNQSNSENSNHKQPDKEDLKFIKQSTTTDPTKKKIKFTLSEDQSKFLIPSHKSKDFAKGNIIERFGRLMEISHIGKEFPFKANQSSNAKKCNFKNGDKVCYVYYFKKEPVFSGEEFLQATKDYYDFISYIKKNGIKPRHKASEVSEIKRSKCLCDSRVKIEGNSWIAINEEYLWYITHKLSPITIDNNIKINNQFAQCWRISLHQISNRISDLEKIDLVLFKSSAIPNAQSDDENEDELI